MNSIWTFKEYTDAVENEEVAPYKGIRGSAREMYESGWGFNLVKRRWVKNKKNPTRLTAVRDRARTTAYRAMDYNPYPNNPNAPSTKVDWCLRQNPYANTDQLQMRNFINLHNTVTCPFGHLNKERDNVINGIYNEGQSHSQDRRFIENMNIGDIILIPFAGIKECILARIISGPIWEMDTGFFTHTCNGTIHVSIEGEHRPKDAKPFRPVGRKIEIIDNEFIVNNKRVLPRRSLSRIHLNSILH
jgi:hypothetical protein